MEEREEEGVKVVDKRHFNADGSEKEKVVSLVDRRENGKLTLRAKLRGILNPRSDGEGQTLVGATVSVAIPEEMWEVMDCQTALTILTAMRQEIMDQLGEKIVLVKKLKQGKLKWKGE